MLNIRQATHADLQTILSFIDEAADWLKLKETDQWARPWPSRKKRDQRVLNGLKDGHTWMVEDESGQPIATVTYRSHANPALWTVREQAEPAAYVSRLIVRRGFAGQCIGSELLDWVALCASSQYQARWVRIDVWTTNTALHGYYRKRGFEFVREASSRYPSAALFQRLATISTPADITRLRLAPESGHAAARDDRFAAAPRSLAWRLAGRGTGLCMLGCSALILKLARRHK